MAQTDRIHELINIFQSNRYAITIERLANQLECSIPTVKRYIGKLRDIYGIPVRYDFKYQGYVIDLASNETIHFPGLWFNVSELHSLLTIHELIDKLDPGFLKAELLPIRARIEKILVHRGVNPEELPKRFNFMGVGIRLCCPLAFRLTATATMERKRLKLTYHSRTEDKISSRQISPQRLLYYRGNWYLVAYCHTRRSLRIFSLERMSDIVPLETSCLEIDEESLRDCCTASFGIFSGQPQHMAVLVFSKESARWVAEERWHPSQQGRWLEDGSFELRQPYADQRELVMEILRYGPEVRVESPPELRLAVRDRLRSALGQYEKNMRDGKIIGPGSIFDTGE